MTRIGIFDSGLGGLTVARAVRAALPADEIVYLGDTARVPYGTRSPRTVERYALGCARTLERRGIEVLVVACNTVSAVALPALRAALDLPVIGVVEPGARAAVAAAPRGRVGVLATMGTVASGAYATAVAALDRDAEVFARAAPLLVPLVEEGWLDGDVPRIAARRYLEPLVAERVDVIVLGCTHYPLLSDVLAAEARALARRALPIVDGSRATAAALAETLGRGAPDRDAPEGPTTLLVTDLPDRFAEVAARFLGRRVDDLPVEAIDLG